MLLLETKNLAKHFGGLKALDGIDLRVERERIVSIIGPNGAGKTTLFNCITGMYRPTKGTALFYDRDIAGMRRYAARRSQRWRRPPRIGMLTIFEPTVGDWTGLFAGESWWRPKCVRHGLR